MKKQIQRRVISPSVQRSPAKIVGTSGHKEAGGVVMKGKTKVTSGPAAGGECKVPSIKGRRLGMR
jgi:hypothetical protein